MALYKKFSAFNPSVPLNPFDVANPCGMIAYTVFNDSFALFSPQGNTVPISSSGIAWPSDI